MQRKIDSDVDPRPPRLDQLGAGLNRKGCVWLHKLIEAAQDSSAFETILLSGLAAAAKLSENKVIIYDATWKMVAKANQMISLYERINSLKSRVLKIHPHRPTIELATPDDAIGLHSLGVKTFKDFKSHSKA